jgi:tryptophanyl-tRNA synthetase
MTKITIDSVEGDINYEQTMKEFGIEPIGSYLKKLESHHELPLMYRRDMVIGHRDFGHIYNAIEHKKKFAVLTGVNPSGSLHLGNLMFLQQALFFQKLGAEVFIPVSNDETYVFKKSDSIEKATENAMEKVIPDIIALGFEEKKTKIFISTKTPRAYELATRLSTKTTFSTLKAIFGFNNETNPGQIFYTVMQSSHILFPQLEEFGGPKPVVVPIGIDQDPYMRLVRDMAEKIGMEKPSSTYHKFLIGLQGGKMSGSKPDTCIYLSDSPEAARKKIMKAFSGGAGSLEDHRKHGGNPEIDVACQYLYCMFEEDDKKAHSLLEDYRKGSLTSGDVKKMLAEKVEKFLDDHHKKSEKAKDRMDKYLIC